MDKFPRLKERGPIEACPSKYRLRPGRVFPRLKERGPIEAAEDEDWEVRAAVVSTLKRAWPH